MTGVGRFHLGDAELGYRAGAICNPVEALVMKGDQNAVASEMDIRLQISVSERYCDLECRERVLGRLTGTTSVGERDRSRLDEERVHVSHSRIPASLTRSAQPLHEPSGRGKRAFGGGPSLALPARSMTQRFAIRS